MTDPRDAARRWASAWQRAWEAQDVEAVVELYATDASLSSEPFRPFDTGRAAVREYVSVAFADEADVRAWFGDPIVEGERAAVQWWAALLESGEETTLAGTSVLRFGTDGLVIEQRDTWNRAPGRRGPPEGWGR